VIRVLNQTNKKISGIEKISEIFLFIP